MSNGFGTSEFGTSQQARLKYEGEIRWMLAKTLVEPHIRAACDDASATSLLPNHEMTLRSGAKAQVFKKCRKTAHSWGFSLFGLMHAMAFAHSETSIGSYDEEEAKNKLRFLDLIYAQLPAGERRDLKMSDGSEQRKFGNGSVLKFLARKAPTGGGGTFLGDEFSVEPPGKVSATDILTAALGATTHKGCVRLAGTERGEDTMFYQIGSGEWAALCDADPLMKNLPSVQWEVVEYPWWCSPALCMDVPTAMLQAPSMDTYDRVLKFGNARLQEQFAIYLRTPNLGLAMFQREFEIKLLADGETYLDLALIQSACARREADYRFYHLDIPEAEAASYTQNPHVLNGAKDLMLALAARVKSGELRGEFMLSQDVGRHSDRDELMIAHNLPEARETVALRLNIGAHKLPFDGKQELLKFAMEHLPILRAAIDGTRGGVGVQLAEWANQRWHKCEMYQFTMASKQVWATGVKARLQAHKALLPYAPPPSLPARAGDYVKLQAQMLQLKKVKTPAGNVLFDVARSKNGHGDAFWSYAMLNDLFGEVTTYNPGNMIIVPRAAPSTNAPAPIGVTGRARRIIV